MFTSGNPQYNHTFDLFKLGYSDRETKGLGGALELLGGIEKKLAQKGQYNIM